MNLLSSGGLRMKKIMTDILGLKPIDKTIRDIEKHLVRYERALKIKKAADKFAKFINLKGRYDLYKH